MKLIIATVILLIPLIWTGKFQLLLENEQFYWWIISGFVFFLCLHLKIKFDERAEKGESILSGMILISVGLLGYVYWFGSMMFYLGGQFGVIGIIYGMVVLVVSGYLVDDWVGIKSLV